MSPRSVHGKVQHIRCLRSQWSSRRRNKNSSVDALHNPKLTYLKIVKIHGITCTFESIYLYIIIPIMVIPHIFPNTLVSCTLIALSLQNTRHFLNFLNILHLCHPVWLPTHWNGRIFVKVLQGNAELDLILSSWRSKGPGNDRITHRHHQKGGKAGKSSSSSKMLVRVGRYVTFVGR